MNDITVLTATYNRKATLVRLVDSLIKQTDLRFDWFVVDDGSEDDTRKYLEELYQRGLPFPFSWVTTENRGRQRAINTAVNQIHTEYVFLVDSDDYLLPNAIRKIIEWVHEVPENYAGVSGVKGRMEKGVIVPIGGEPEFPGAFVDCLNTDRAVWNLQADMAEVYRTNLLRKYPFDVWPGENFVPEAVVWDEIALEGHPLRWYRDVIYVCEYREDGLTRNSWSLLKKNPMGYAMLFNHQLKTESNKRHWRIALQMDSCLWLAGELFYIRKCNRPFLAALLLPMGFLLSLRRRWQFKCMGA